MLRGVTRPSWLIHRASSQGRAQFWALATRPLKQLARAGATEEKPLLWPEEKTKDSTESLQGHGREAQGDEEGRLTPSAVERCGRHELPSACSQQRKPAVLSVTRTATMWLVGDTARERGCRVRERPRLQRGPSWRERGPCRCGAHMRAPRGLSEGVPCQSRSGAGPQRASAADAAGHLRARSRGCSAASW